MINESNCSQLIEYIIHRHPWHKAAHYPPRPTPAVNDTQFGYPSYPVRRRPSPLPLAVFMEHKGRRDALFLVHLSVHPAATVLHNLRLHNTETRPIYTVIPYLF